MKHPRTPKPPRANSLAARLLKLGTWTNSKQQAADLGIAGNSLRYAINRLLAAGLVTKTPQPREPGQCGPPCSRFDAIPNAHAEDTLTRLLMFCERLRVQNEGRNRQRLRKTVKEIRDEARAFLRTKREA